MENQTNPLKWSSRSQVSKSVADAAMHPYSQSPLKARVSRDCDQSIRCEDAVCDVKQILHSITDSSCLSKQEKIIYI